MFSSSAEAEAVEHIQSKAQPNHVLQVEVEGVMFDI
jgi:hypothetical protein